MIFHIYRSYKEKRNQRQLQKEKERMDYWAELRRERELKELRRERELKEDLIRRKRNARSTTYDFDKYGSRWTREYLNEPYDECQCQCKCNNYEGENGPGIG